MSEVVQKGALPTFDAETVEAHVYAWRMVHEELEERLWMLGAIAASLTRHYGEQSIPEFAKEVNYSPRRVYELSQTYTAWQFRDRAHDLSFKHHTIAARADDPEKAIERAIEHRLSTRQLEHEIKGGEKLETIVCPRCGGEGRIPKEDK